MRVGITKRCMGRETVEHDFDNTVVAILDREPSVESATEMLTHAGYDFEVLEGEEGRKHIDPRSEEGLMGTVKRLIAAFGDQHRIIDRLDAALQEGRKVVSVQTEEGDSGEAISILKDHGGHYIWRLGEWTFARIED